jgi:hypothetical protein
MVNLQFTLASVISSIMGECWVIFFFISFFYFLQQKFHKKECYLTLQRLLRPS